MTASGELRLSTLQGNNGLKGLRGKPEVQRMHYYSVLFGLQKHSIMQAEKLSIGLPVDMAQMIGRQVEDGAYASVSKVMRGAVRLWQDRGHERQKRLESLRAKIKRRRKIPSGLPTTSCGNTLECGGLRPRKSAIIPGRMYRGYYGLQATLPSG
jgi:antitoxin ParD1/3/4